MTAKIEMVFLFTLIMLMACDNNLETSEDTQPAALSNDPKVLLENSKEKQRIGAYDESIEILNVAFKIDHKFVPA